jgi:hypothetical protein
MGQYCGVMLIASATAIRPAARVRHLPAPIGANARPRGGTHGGARGPIGRRLRGVPKRAAELCLVHALAQKQGRAAFVEPASRHCLVPRQRPETDGDAGVEHTSVQVALRAQMMRTAGPTAVARRRVRSAEGLRAGRSDDRGRDLVRARQIEPLSEPREFL